MLGGPVERSDAVEEHEQGRAWGLTLADFQTRQNRDDGGVGRDEGLYVL